MLPPCIANVLEALRIPGKPLKGSLKMCEVASSPAGESSVQLRRLPYPYRAMLAICSDLDETADKDVYLEIMRFLNTSQMTAMGEGVGLEIGNSIYFDMPPGQFSYWNTDESGRDMIRSLIRSGHIDCLHSYGNLALKRAHAGRALDELTKWDCYINLWVDHSTAVSNFGSDIMRGRGDVPQSEAYHADLTTGYGIQFVWRGRVTSVIGQDIPRSLGSLFAPGHPVTSIRTIGKEWVKGICPSFASAKYAMHGVNNVLRPGQLRDGTEIYEFMRFNPHWGGISFCEDGRGIGQVLNNEMLETLIRREGTSVLYTHLGKVDDLLVQFIPSVVSGFRRLARAHRDGQIMVTTTCKLLRFNRAMREISFDVTRHGPWTHINLHTKANSAIRSLGPLSGDDIEGITFYVGDPDRTHLSVDGRRVPRILRNLPDHTNRPSVSLPWTALEFPDL